MRADSLVRALFRFFTMFILLMAGAAWLSVSGALAQVTYTYNSNTYDTVDGTGYTTAMRVTGDFAVPVKLSPNMPPGTDITGQILNYSFNDGTQTLTEANSYMVFFEVGTDAFCRISSWRITIWQGDSTVFGIDTNFGGGPASESLDQGFQGVPCATTLDGRCVETDLSLDTGTGSGNLNSVGPATPGVWIGPSCPETPPVEYTYSGNNYNTLFGSGYTTAMRVTGSFTVPVKLSPNMPPGTDISSQILGYSFNDGAQTLTDTNSYLVFFEVGTDAFCRISSWRITVWSGDDTVFGIDTSFGEGPPEQSLDQGFQGYPCAATSGGRCVEEDLDLSAGTGYGNLESMDPGTPGVWSGPTCPETPPAEYTYISNTYDTVEGVGYTTAMRVTVGFTVPAKLTPNMPPGTDISSQVLSYSFNDGAQTLTDVNSYIVAFEVGTDPFCRISSWRITVWSGDSIVSGIDVFYGAGPPEHSIDQGFQGVPCATTLDGRCVDSIALANGTGSGVLDSYVTGTPGVWSGSMCPETPPVDYTYNGNNYDTIFGSGYSTAMRITGGFTLPAKLPRNMPSGTDISKQVLGYSFNDGAQTLTDANSYIINFKVGTDPFCNISFWNITIWSGDSTVSGMDIIFGAGSQSESKDQGFQGVPCATTFFGRCIEDPIYPDDGTGYGRLQSIGPPTPGDWTGPSCEVVLPPMEAVPTINEWGLILLAGLLACVSVWILVRRRAV